MEERKKKYAEYCQRDRSIPLFLTHGWLSTVVPDDQWDVALAEKGGELFAALPYTWTFKWGFKIVNMPPLTPYLGVWIRYPEGQKEGTRLSYEKEVMTELIGQLGSYSYFRQHFLPQITNGLPFYWSGFRQSNRYTYILEKPAGVEAVFEGFQQNIRRQIKKAEKSLKVVESEDIDRLYQLKISAYEEKGRQLQVSKDYLRKLFAYCRQMDCGKLFSAQNEEGNVHAMVLVVWDHEYCYYLFGASLPDQKNSGAMSLLMWHSIQLAMEKGLSFNFEGSMVESVERFFRSFGARQLPYMAIEKYRSLAYRLLTLLKRKIN